jgi:aminoglycoside N3'-acetyltransferase
MPSLCDDDDAVFDPRSTPCRGMGIVAETFWRLPGVQRSDSPHAFAAFGPQARAITRDRPLTVPHGLESPVGRVHEQNGSVLLLGVGHEANTTLHLAENLAGVRYGLPAHVLVSGEDGRRTRLDYVEVDHCCQRFELVSGWLDDAGSQRRGPVGHGEARLFRSRDAVAVALEHLRADETVFLHPPNQCAECDRSRSGLARDRGV